jgi:hypothetical protein
MGDGQRRRRPSSQPDKASSSTQLQAELAALRTQVRELSKTIGILKDILQVKDNWHSHISRMIGKEVWVYLVVDINNIDAIDGPQRGRLLAGVKLLWTDRYNIAVLHEGRELILNKGHIVGIREA